ARDRRRVRPARSAPPPAPGPPPRWSNAAYPPASFPFQAAPACPMLIRPARPNLAPRPARRLTHEAGKRGRVVEGSGLENRQRGNPFVGSNPTASAKLSNKKLYLRLFFARRSVSPTKRAPTKSPPAEADGAPTSKHVAR